MPLREGGSDLTGFVTPDGQFQWTGQGGIDQCLSPGLADR